MNASQPRRWWLAKNKQRLGPFTVGQLEQMAASGVIQPTDMLLAEGASRWCPAGEARGLCFAGAPAKAEKSLSSHPERKGKKARAAICVAIVLLVAAGLAVGLVLLNKASPGNREQATEERQAQATHSSTSPDVKAPAQEPVKDSVHKPGSEKGNRQENQTSQDIPQDEGSPNRRFWRFVPEYGSGYFKQLADGTWEEKGRNGELMGVWIERRRTSEYVELEDRKRGYLSRLGDGKAWIASSSDGKFGPSPPGNWENDPSGLTRKEKRPLSEKNGGQDGNAAGRQEDRALEQEMQRAVSEFDQQARRDIAEIDQQIAKYRKDYAEWDARRQVVQENFRENPYDEINRLQVLLVNQDLDELEKTLPEINDNINTKKSDFEKRRKALLERYPDAKLPPWLSDTKPLEKWK